MLFWAQFAPFPLEDDLQKKMADHFTLTLQFKEENWIVLIGSCNCNCPFGNMSFQGLLLYMNETMIYGTRGENHFYMRGRGSELQISGGLPPSLTVRARRPSPCQNRGEKSDIYGNAKVSEFGANFSSKFKLGCNQPAVPHCELSGQGKGLKRQLRSGNSEIDINPSTYQLYWVNFAQKPVVICHTNISYKH